MIPEVASKYYCRLPGGSAFMTFLEKLDDGKLLFIIVRDDGKKRAFEISEEEWEDFQKDYIVVRIEEENEQADDFGPGFGKDDRYI